VLCCSSTNCNRPSPALDPHTKVSMRQSYDMHAD
jgi:hypothetical protein